ncbi:YbfB/YjiJ family MFS transporter [Pseudescherichia sp.]|uniref:YbfB/YjiJ family MFS transporter n=1 Tax=Pseudescherichia sp. TaxID=2055881 RepID=UPI002896DF4B|nr:YbfB/YjiJ family MFS transporter [Pseudescherichia sp.]
MSSQQISDTVQTGRLATGSISTMLTGIITLVVVMGIGRFSLTPQIPVMINDGFLNLSSAGILAAMNYIGYLLGAIHVSRMRSNHATYLKTGLLAAMLVTILSGATSSFALQCLFRFIAGVGGAWALIIVTSWTQLELAAKNAPRLSAAVFSGPGIGITLTGVLAWVMSTQYINSSTAWYVYGVVALVAILVIFRHLPHELPSVQKRREAAPLGRNLKLLLGVYTLAGFGYILPATFLSQMAHAVFSSGNQAAFFWPLFGLSAVTGVLLVIMFAAVVNTRISLALAMLMQGVGVAAPVVANNAVGLLISTVLTGLCFLSIMQLSMRLAREVSSGEMAKTVGMLTAGYATGQLTGPLVSSACVALFASLEPALLLAAGCLIAGGGMVLFMIRK